MNRLLSIVACSCVVLAAGAGARADGPPIGVAQQGTGIVSPDGKLRYFTIAEGQRTLLEAVTTHDGTLWSDTLLRGRFAIPAIGWTPTGMTPDGKTLVLTTYPFSARGSTFLLLTAPTFETRQLVTLPGSWSYDAISPDGRTLYLIQSLAADQATRYRVRAYDLRQFRLLPGAIADRRESGPMTGSAVTRAETRDGRWAYTLYTRGNGTAFVHALDTVRRRAVCVDLPWRHASTWIWAAHLRLGRDGRTLLLRTSSEPGADIDTRTWKVRVRSVF
jgi:hypothetical protein